MRAGTENVAGLVGFGAAAAMAGALIPEETRRLRDLRDRLHRRLSALIPDLRLNRHPEQRLPNTLNVSFPHALGQAVLAGAPEVAASTGAACHSGMTEPSSVLMAMGFSRERALGAVRLSLGRYSTADDMERAASALAAAHQALAPGPILR